MNQVGIKSEKLYEVKSLYGLVHDLSLICREYKSGVRLYILKIIITYYNDGVQRKKVFKNTFRNKDTALKALKQRIYDFTINNIDFQIINPF